MSAYILFSPWKSGSSEFNRQIESRGKVVFKEVLHEDRYESHRLFPGIDDGWSEFRKTNIGCVKYIRPENLDRRALAYYALLAEDILKFLRFHSKQKTVVLQFAESMHTCQILHSTIGKLQNTNINGAPKLRRTLYSKEAQFSSIYHNYLEGNAYFVANIFLIYIFNHPLSPIGIRRAVAAMSCTGAISFAISIVGILPLRWILTLIDYYVYDDFKNNAQVMHASENKDESWRLNDLTKQRYPFIYADRARFTEKTELDNLGSFLRDINISNSLILRNHVNKNLIEITSRDDAALLRMYFDRCFKTNAGFNCNGELFALCNLDSISLSTSIDKPRRIFGLILDCDESITKICLMIDGAIAKIDRSCKSIPKKFQNLFEKTPIYFDVFEGNCKIDLHITLHCEKIPAIYFLSN